MEEGFFIVWPERRWISDDQMSRWYEDAVANEAVEPGEQDVSAMARALHEAGEITLGREGV